jgi:NADPH:quinone reductase-like Zn-dependent oxidoreductase
VIAYRVVGGYADHVVARAADVFPKPTELSFEQAAGLMLTGVTAAHLVSATAVGEGDTVLLHGAAGGVGLVVVQLAVARGARVIATAGESRHQSLRELGAEPVTYGDGLADRVRALAPGGVDVALDTVGTDEAVDASVDLVADRSRIATIAAFARAPALGIQLLGGGPGADPGTALRSAARGDLLGLVAEGTLTVLVAASYPLEDVRAAHEQVATGHTHGKVVLVP